MIELGVKTVCETNVCFLWENRDLFGKTEANSNSNVFKISSNLFDSLQNKISAGFSCGITTRLVKSDERSKLESGEEVECDKKFEKSVWIVTRICPFPKFHII